MKWDHKKPTRWEYGSSMAWYLSLTDEEIEFQMFEGITADEVEGLGRALINDVAPKMRELRK